MASQKRGNSNFDDSNDYSHKSKTSKKSIKRSLSTTPRKSKRVSKQYILNYEL